MVATVKDRLGARSRPGPAIGLAPQDRKHDDDVPSISNADLFVEHEPTVRDFFVELAPSAQAVARYVYNLFPFVHWIGKYNSTWFVGDFIAGTTVGAVVVPQGMAYAQLAQLPVEYGLYSSFMGVLIYWFFATSKDITIGPVAVMSQVTGNVVLKARDILPDVPGHVVASALAILTGAIILFCGLARLGCVVEFIPLPAICAFMTGSAINILSGQVPKLMGIKGVNTREPPYRVIIDTLKGLPISTLRTVFVILLYTAISAAVNVSVKDKPKFGIIQEVPRGFQHAAVPEINSEIIKAFSSELPAAVIVMLIEHISISKSFGRINNYVIDPSQELVAIGVSNLLGPFLGAYPATGSFSRTAIKSKAGVRTPFAGVITAIVVLLALYALTAVFYYIPNAALAAVIIHAVGDVITPPSVILQFWRVSPLEVPIFLAGVLVTVFNTIENGIYTTVCLSFVVVIWRLFLSRGRLLGLAPHRTVKAMSNGQTGGAGGAQKEAVAEESDLSYIPVVVIQSPYPGVFIYRFAEGFNYPNASRYLNHLTETIFRGTRRTDPSTLGKLGDRPWNDTEPRTQKTEDGDLRPTLKAVILDFSSVNNIDVTATQALIDVRNQLDRYAAPDTVNWHFANIENRWTKRALAAAGFGFRTPKPDPATGMPAHWKTIFSIADLGGSDSAATAAAMDEKAERKSLLYDTEEPLEPAAATGSQLSDKDVPRNPGSAQLVAVQGLNRPFFHFDLQEAVEAALLHAERDD
ncbi:sulfate permease II [Ophiocordyceps sinensis CO18]|uniref:Sulfate permease II n=1 Tax=Ophiocordyceps sinensis (strain Co18 / CGMCC 3.14243) TaxID=911162 RepID=T5ACE3_OPHSC|nr:sulfate permease II [Ophiocordyceps sinensis CO18]